MNIDIVIVNWNSGVQLMACIDSVRAFGAGHVGRCTVVDNGSTDGSTAFLDGADDVDLVQTGENLGFGRACNLGAARGDSPVVLFLNPDACLMEGSLAVPLEYLARPENRQTGIVGVALTGENGAVQRSCARFPRARSFLAKAFGIAAVLPGADFHMRDWDHAETRAVDHVIGAFYCVRRALFRELGGFDERFFVYLEDLDFSRRAAQAGFASVYLTGARAFHKGGGVSDQVRAHRLFYSLRSRLQYAFKHFFPVSAVAVTLATLVVEPVSRVVLLLLQRRRGEIGDLGRGYGMLWGWALRAPFAGTARNQARR